MNKQIPLRQSGFYRMFVGEESYRQACYQCPYASLDKPADITIGDYFEAQRDYPDLFSGKDAIDTSMGISCLVTHTDKGRELIEQAQAYLYRKEVDLQRVQMSHGNLQRPSRCSHLREKLLSDYRKKGYASIERYYRVRNLVIAVPRMLVRILRRNG